MPFQVTPYWKSDSAKKERRIDYVIITYVMLYRMDPGVSLGVDGGASVCSVGMEAMWGMLNLIKVFPNISSGDLTSIKTGHCGDSETVRVYVNYDGKSWSGSKIYIYRHGQSVGPIWWNKLTIERVTSNTDDCGASRGTCNHPVLYVSQNKHAMYPALTGSMGCETIGSKSVTYKGVGCTISWEDCDSSDSDDVVYPWITFYQNVGENKNHRTSRVDYATSPNAEYYPNEWIWKDSTDSRDNVFCGGYDPGSKLCSPIGCAGALNDKWIIFNYDSYEKIKNYTYIP